MADVAAFQALADATRLRIMKLLTSESQSICVCELVDALGLPQYLVSKHLTVLRQAGLVEVDRLGTWAGYRPHKSPSPLCQAIYDLVDRKLAGPSYERDLARLRARMELREGGRCVVGYNDPRVPPLLGVAEQQGGEASAK